MFNLNQHQLYLYPTDPYQLPIQLTQQPQESKPIENIQQMYYQQYKKIYQTTYKLWIEGNKQKQLVKSLHSQIMHLEGELNVFSKKKRLEENEEICQGSQKHQENRLSKRNRRTAEKIIRQFVCPHERCDKSYGSDGSLQQHLKHKHPQHKQIEKQFQ